MTRYWSTAAIAVAARTGLAAPEITLHDCAIESMRHSILLGRAERRAVIEVTAPIPVAVPSVPLERFRKRRRMTSARSQRARSSRRISANGANAWQRRVEEPSEPDALALACLADAIHAVVPVAGFEQRNSVDSNRKALVQSKCAMFEDGAALFGDRGLKKRFNLARVELRPVEERDRFRRGCRRRPSPLYNERPHTRARRDRRRYACERPAPRAAATNVARRPRQTDATLPEADARASDAGCAAVNAITSWS